MVTKKFLPLRSVSDEELNDEFPKVIDTISLGPWTQPTGNLRVVFQAFYASFGAIDGFSECDDKQREYPLSNKYGWRYPTDKEVGYLKITETEKRIVAQNIRASSLNHKACTILFGDSVIKGPYSPKKSMLALVYERFKRHKDFGDEWFIPWDIIKYKDHMYLISPNIGRLSPQVHWGQYFKGRCAWMAMESEVIDGRTELSKGDLGTKWFGLLYHFLIRYLLRGGDSGLHNTINGLGIDFEDIRGNTNVLSMAGVVGKSGKEEVNAAFKIHRVGLCTRFLRFVKDGLTPPEQERYDRIIRIFSPDGRLSV